MQLRETLIAVSNDARGWLKYWAGDFTQTEALDSRGATTNPLAWYLGHLAVTEDLVSDMYGGKNGVTSKELRAICGTGCPTPTRDTHFPVLAELWGLLDQTHANLLALAERATDADFDRPPRRESRFFRTFGQSIYELALHENYHVGEIATLRKAWGKNRLR